MRSLITFAALTACLLGCLGGPDDRTAGVDDFPNTIYARVNGFLDESKQSDDVSNIPAVADSILKLHALGPAAKRSASSVRTAARLLQTLTVPPAGPGRAGPAADTLPCVGLFTYSDTIPSPLSIKVDTLQFCVDALFLDTIKGNENIVRGKSVTTFTSGRVEIMELEDADGDELVTPAPGGKSKARIAIAVLDSGVTERTVLVAGPGPDNDFDTEPDNLLYQVGWTKTSGNDTLAQAVYTDADSDGVAIDNGKPSLVDLELFQKGPTKDDPDAEWSLLNMRLLAAYKVKKQDVKRFRMQVKSKDGRTQTAEIRNRRGGPDMDKQDTLEAHLLLQASSPSDSLDSMKTVFIMSTGPDFEAKGDDSVYAFHVNTWKKLGEEKSASFDFRSDRPMPSGAEPHSGALAMRVEYADSTFLDLDGKLTDATLDVIFTDRLGKRMHVIWDKLGRTLKVEVLK